MDDLAKSEATTEEAVHVYQYVKMTLQKRGFNLLEWTCNNDVVTRNIPEKDRSEAKCEIFEGEPHNSSPLGMQWDVDNNTLEACCGADKEVPNKMTQQAVVSFVASVFDLLGLFAPFATSMRILLKTV